jgi:hypothetical protein
MKRLLLPIPLLLLFISKGVAQPEELDCPEGEQRVSTDNPYAPFKCQVQGAPGSLLSTVGSGRGFKTRPRCPSGFHPVMTPNKLQPYRCVKKAPGGGAEPDLDTLAAPAAEQFSGRGVTIGAPKGPKECPEGTKRVKIQDDPFDPWRCVDAGLSLPKAWRKYTIPGELGLEFPRDWHLTDGWKDEVPTLYILHDGGGAQKVTLSVTRFDASQDAFEPLDKHLVKEREWQGARDLGKYSVSGKAARMTEIPEQGRTAYLPISTSRYYSFSYSAPPELYKSYLPVYERLLKSFKLL